MPRYHFNVYDGVSLPDDDGTELADIQAARQEAIRFAGRIIADEAHTLALSEDWRMEVTDNSGILLFRLDVVVTASEAAMDATGHNRGASGTGNAAKLN